MDTTQNRIDALKGKYKVSELAAILAVLTDGNQDDAVELAKMSEDYLARKVTAAETLFRSAENVHAELTETPKSMPRTQRPQPISPTLPQKKEGLWDLAKRSFRIGAGTENNQEN